MGSITGAELNTLADSVQKTVTDLVKAKAAALQYNDPQTAIKILDKAVKIVYSRELELLLGEILNVQSVKVINGIVELAEAGGKDSGESILSRLEKEVANLERAVELGCKNAVKNLEAARNLLEQAGQGMLGVSAGVMDAINRATQAAGSNETDKAIGIIKNALQHAGYGEQAPLKAFLAQLLNQRGVQKANRVNDSLSGRSEQVSAKLKALMNGWGKVDLWIIGLFKLLFTGLGRLGNIFWVLILHYYFVQLIFIIAKIDPSSTLGVLLTIGIMVFLFIIFISACVKRSKSTECGVKLCLAPARFSHSLPGSGQVQVCARHSKKIQSIVKNRMKPDPKTKDMLFDAANDLRSALEYDPANSQIKANLQSVMDMITSSS